MTTGSVPVTLPGPAPSIPGLAVRRLHLDADASALAALIQAVNVHDGVPWIPTAEELKHDFSRDAGFDPSADAVLAEADGALVGAATVSWRIRGERVFHSIEPWVRPDLRRRGLGRALVAWGEAHARAGIPSGTMGPLGLTHVFAGWSDLEIDGSTAFGAALGYETEGFGVIMRRDLTTPIADAPMPPGLELRPVRPKDHRLIWDADVEAFRDHRDPALRTEADYERWFSTPGLDTGLWPVAWDGDEVAGSVMAFVFGEENERFGVRRGWLEHVSVRRPWRRRGLASALMTEAMRRLRALGIEEAMLGADAENLTGAVRVYEALGFRRHRTAANYRKAVDGI